MVDMNAVLAAQRAMTEALGRGDAAGAAVAQSKLIAAMMAAPAPTPVQTYSAPVPALVVDPRTAPPPTTSAPTVVSVPIVETRGPAGGPAAQQVAADAVSAGGGGGVPADVVAEVRRELIAGLFVRAAPGGAEKDDRYLTREALALDAGAAFLASYEVGQVEQDAISLLQLGAQTQRLHALDWDAAQQIPPQMGYGHNAAGVDTAIGNARLPQVTGTVQDSRIAAAAVTSGPADVVAEVKRELLAGAFTAGTKDDKFLSREGDALDAAIAYLSASNPGAAGAINLLMAASNHQRQLAKLWTDPNPPFSEQVAHGAVVIGHGITATVDAITGNFGGAASEVAKAGASATSPIGESQYQQGPRWGGVVTPTPNPVSPTTVQVLPNSTVTYPYDVRPTGSQGPLGFIEELVNELIALVKRIFGG